MSTNSISYMRNYTNQRQQQLIYLLGGKCLICASRESLEVHHIFGYEGINHTGRGKRQRVAEWGKNMSKLALLCTDHHIEYHQFCEGVLNHDTLLDYILYKFIENKEFDNK